MSVKAEALDLISESDLVMLSDYFWDKVKASSLDVCWFVYDLIAGNVHYCTSRLNYPSVEKDVYSLFIRDRSLADAKRL